MTFFNSLLWHNVGNDCLVSDRNFIDFFKPELYKIIYYMHFDNVFFLLHLYQNKSNRNELLIFHSS